MTDIKPEDLRDGALHLDARVIPVPHSISAAAQQALVATATRAKDTPPAPDDIAAWHRFYQDAESRLLPMFQATLAKYDVTSEPENIAGVKSFVSVPAKIHAGMHDKVFYDIHGGALVVLGGESCRAMGSALAGMLGMRIVSVDYRMPPDHPYPAALDDCVAVYAALVQEHGAENIVVGGPSAGGNLAAATMLRARDEGLPLPAGLVLLSPEADLTESGDTFQTNDGVDVMQRARITAALNLYANGHDLSHPYLSPLFGDFKGFPRTFLQSGTRDMFLSNTVRLHRSMRKSGVEAHLHVWEAMPHGAFFGVPEEDEVNEETRNFVYGCFK